MSLFPIPQTVKRRSGAYVKGVWTKTDDETFIAYGSIQPISAEELEFWPEARNIQGASVFYTTTLLYTTEEDGNTPSDVVVYDGKNWEVVQRKNFNSGVISHYQYLLQHQRGT